VIDSNTILSKMEVEKNCKKHFIGEVMLLFVNTLKAMISPLEKGFFRGFKKIEIAMTIKNKNF